MIIFIFVTCGDDLLGEIELANHAQGMALPQGLQLSILRSIRNVSHPPLARVSAAHAPAGRRRRRRGLAEGPRRQLWCSPKPRRRAPASAPACRGSSRTSECCCDRADGTEGRSRRSMTWGQGEGQRRVGVDAESRETRSLLQKPISEKQDCPRGAFLRTRAAHELALAQTCSVVGAVAPATAAGGRRGALERLRARLADPRPGDAVLDRARPRVARRGAAGRERDTWHTASMSERWRYIA